MRGRARNAGTIWFIGAGHEYAGVGPGAHGRLNIDGRRYATETEKKPESWLMRVEAKGNGLIVDEKLQPGEVADEFLLMGLRLAEGIEPERFTRARRPHARSAADFISARRRRGGDHRQTAACASRNPDFRCSMRWSPIWRRKRIPASRNLTSPARTTAAPG